MREQIVQGLRLQAETRWADIQKHAPKKAQEMRLNVDGIDDIFDHFSDLFGDFFPPTDAERSAEAAPEGASEADSEETPEDA